MERTTRKQLEGIMARVAERSGLTLGLDHHGTGIGWSVDIYDEDGRISGHLTGNGSKSELWERLHTCMNLLLNLEQINREQDLAEISK